MTKRASNPNRMASTTGALSAPVVDESAISRRRMLQGMLAVGGVGVMGGLPALGNAAEAAPLGPGEKILVVVTLDGGNDALNTVIPMNNGRYRDLRGSLAITSGIRSIGGGLGLHPNLSFMKQQHDAGRLATVLGIGEPTKDHSHFSCMARWMGGRAGNPPFTSGWCGRYLDDLQADPVAGVAIGNQGVPLVLQRNYASSVGLPILGDLFGSDRTFPDTGGTKPVVHAHRALKNFGNSGLSSVADQLMSVQAEAIDIAVDVNPAFSPTISASLPQFVHDMKLAARVINLDVGVRVVHVEYPGFDTHSKQRPLHDQMLDVLDRGLAAFTNDLRNKFDSRTAVLVYSEFGRRGARNGSAATDHGAGGTAFVLGGAVTGGRYGEQPSLRKLDKRGDLRASLDHRALYATILDKHLGVDADPILGGNYERLRIFDDPVYCRGQLATHVGTAGADTLMGTKRGDVIVGRAGNDTIRGKGGDDTVCAGGGADDVEGGAGHDKIWGDKGADRIKGNKGRDRLVGGTGPDTLIRDKKDTLVQQ